MKHIYFILLFSTFALATKSGFCQNPGFESTPIGNSNGWALEVSFSQPTWTWGNSTNRSGGRRLDASTTTSNNRNAAHTSYTVTVPGSGTNYIHVIGYYRRTAGSVRMEARGTTSINGTLESGATGQWNRATASGTATNGGTYHPRFSFQGSSSASYAFDDIIIYTSTSSGVDLTAPNSSTGLSATKNGSDVDLVWTDGADNTTNISGVEGTLILRIAGNKTTAIPTPQAQTWYSTNSGIGPTTIVNGSDTWTVLHNGSASGSYTNAGAAGNDYTYVVYMRDKAFNYSTGTAIFYEVSTFENPTSGGTIGNAQWGCDELNPSAISNIAGASGHSGTLVYKWQHSTTNSSSGFSDISSSNSTTYDPPLIAQTIWYRRLAIVSEVNDWDEAAISNVIEMSVLSAPSSVTVGVAPNPVCVGDTVFLTASASGVDSWMWNGPNGFIAEVKDTFLADISMSEGGNYFVTAENACGNGGQEKTFNQTDLSPWAVQAGDFANAGFWNYLRGDNCCTEDRISAPSTQAYGTWEFEYQFYSTSTTCPTNNQIVRFFLISSTAGMTSANGYYVYVDVCNNAFQLRKLTAGTPSTIISGTWSPNITSWHNVKITRSADNTFELFHNGVSKGTGIDASFTSSNHMGIWTTGAFVSDNHRIKYVKAISNYSNGPIVVIQPNLTSINNAITPNMTVGDYLWSGKTNTPNWESARNWLELVANDTFYLAPTIPSTTKNVFLVTTSTANQCVMSEENKVSDIAGNVAKNIVIESGFALEMIAEAEFSIYGNWINNGGIFLPAQSSVIFKGTVQTIKSSWASGNENSFYYLVIDNNDTVTITDNTNVLNKTIIETGEFIIPEDRVARSKKVELKDRLLIKDKGTGTKGGEMRVNE
jgi:hypothetical protein